MSRIDSNWFNTDVGVQIMQSVKHDGKVKNFGLLEKPTLSGPYSQYEEINYKIWLVGKAFSGKTSFINSLCQSISVPSSFTAENENKPYRETPGIQIKHLYWPVKMINHDKFMMFNLAMWDAGHLASSKHFYIDQSSSKNADCVLYIFSWTDKQSFLEIYESIRTDYLNSQQQKVDVPRIVIGTKFDQIVHTDIDQGMIDELESLTRSKIIRYSSINCSFEQISQIMNKLCEVLWDRDKRSIPH